MVQKICTYTFHYQNPKHSYGYILLLFGGIIGFCIFLVVWTDFMVRIPWYIHLILLVLWILALRRNFKKVKAENEEVTLTSDGFESALFGFVAYEDIQSYRISLLQAKINSRSPVPTLVIKLKYGQAIRFDLSLIYDQQDYRSFFDFIVRFSELMKNDHPEIYQKAQKKLDQYEIVVRHPKRYLKRVAGWGTGFIIIELAISQVIQCNPDLFTTGHVLKMQENASVDFAQQKKVLQQAIAKGGAVYLLSNDTTVNLRLMPNMDPPKAHYPGGSLLRKLDIMEKTENFLAHKDSLEFYTTIDFGKTVIDQIPIIPIKKAPGIKYLYLTLLNKEGTNSIRKPMVMNWGIAYQEILEIQDQLNQCIPPFERAVVHYLRIYPNCRPYVSASQSKGTDLKMFKRAIQQVKDLLKQSKIDTSQFNILVFNEKEG